MRQADLLDLRKKRQVRPKKNLMRQVGEILRQGVLAKRQYDN
jgi:hypothetical protein